MESAQCRCKHSGMNNTRSGHSHQGPIFPGQNQLKAYPVQTGYTVGLTCQPGSQKTVAQSQPSDFHDAVNSLRAEPIEELLRNDPMLVHQKGFNGQLPLHRACLRGDPAVVRLLLRYKADPNSADDFDETPVHFACKRANLPVIHSLIQSGASLTAEDRAGKGALHHAAHGGSVLMMHYLLETCHLNPFICDRNISTPMHIICMHGHVEIFNYFLRKERCDPFSKDAQGNNLLHIAAANGNGWMCWHLLEHSGYRLLGEVNSEGCTALDLAKRGSQAKYKEIVKMLTYYSKQVEKTGPVQGPVLAWYGLLVLPVVMFPVIYLLASCFMNRGPVTLVGLVLIIALRFFHSHRMNHISRYPSPAHAGLFLAGMFYTVSCFYLEILPYLYSSHTLLVAVSVILMCCMIYSYSVLLIRDPGVIKSSVEKLDLGSLYSVGDIASGLLQPDRFCHVCEVIPPVMSFHCRLCNKCYLKVDHHCLYLYRCIAVRNYRIFIFFTTVVLICMIIFDCCCILYWHAIYPEQDFDWVLVLSIFATCPFTWLLFVLNAFSIIWSLWLLRMQLLTIMNGRILANQPYYAKSHLSLKQKTMNVVHFILNKEPYALDDVCTA